MPSKDHFLTLDLLRGVAALSVLFDHFFFDEHLSLFGSGYLAVDCFFLLSGFVIAHSYEQRLLTTMPARRFFVARVIRLYPLVIAGVLIELFRLSFGALVLKGTPLDPAYLVATAANLLMIPVPFDIGAGSEVYPMDSPLWSLFFEGLINFAYAIWLIRLNDTWLFVVAVLSGFALLLLNVTGIDPTGVGGGAEVNNFYTGVPRVMFSFCLGVLLYRLRRQGRLPHYSAGPFLLALILLIVLVPPRLFWTPLGELDLVGLVFPVLVLLGANHEPKGLPAKMSQLFGDLSYPIYVLHMPLLALYGRALLQLHMMPRHASALVMLIGTVYVCVVAWVVLRLYDKPVRAFLSGRWHGRIRPPQSVAADAPQGAADAG